jgi:hypothetical protein
MSIDNVKILENKIPGKGPMLFHVPSIPKPEGRNSLAQARKPWVIFGERRGAP